MPLKIYEAEKAVKGLAKKMAAKSSITLSAAAKPGKFTPPPKNITLTSSEIDDLNADSVYPIDSVLVTSVINRNDVYFQAADIVAAVKTPINKPVNLEHDELDIIGVTVGSYAVNEDFEPIDLEAADLELPEKIHIINSDLIYKFWRDEERLAQIGEIIEEIEAAKDGDAKWFVSMECFFDEFDYAVEKSSGVYNIVARSEDTAYLTKYLRVWGGKGSFEGHKVVLVPRKFVFSGKGLVENPANVESVILNTVAAEVAPKKVSLQSNIGEKKMDNETLLVNENKDLKATVASLTQKVESLTASVAKKEVDGLTAKITELTASVEGKDKAIASLNETINTLNEKVKTTEAALTEAEKSAADIKSEVASLKAEHTKATRKTSLVAAGADAEQADTLVVSFAALTDEQFASTLSALTATFAKAAISTEADPAKTGPKMINSPDPKTTAAADDEMDDDTDDEEKPPKKKAAKAAIAAIDNADAEGEPVLPAGTAETKTTRSMIASYFDSAEEIDRRKVSKRRGRKKADSE